MDEPTPSHGARLRARLRSGEAVVAGVLSGTSVDGIDVGLVRFADATPELLAFETQAFDPALRDRIERACAGTAHTPGELALLHRDVGVAFGRAARRVAEANGLPLDLVGSHGQTIWHHDGVEPAGRATLQIGEPAHVAEAAGAWVVADFRQADVAAGGEGAPLSALVDDVLFARAPRPCVVLNLGGIANVTLLGARAAAPPSAAWAFDVGPAGALLDGLARALFDEPFDRDGARAARGVVEPSLVEALLEHPFLDRVPPKTTGRDTFGAAYLEAFLARASGRAPEDLLASAAASVAEAVARAIARFGPAALGGAPPAVLAVAGGGVHHTVLRRELGARTGLRVASADAFGVDPDAREALCFAWLARCALLERPSTAPGVTGARSGRILGSIHPGAPIPR